MMFLFSSVSETISLNRLTPKSFELSTISCDFRSSFIGAYYCGSSVCSEQEKAEKAINNEKSRFEYFMAIVFCLD